MTAPVMGHDTVAILRQEEHLGVPHVGVQGPSVRERHDRPFAPVLVVNLGSVFCSDRAHGPSSLRFGGESPVGMKRRRSLWLLVPVDIGDVRVLCRSLYSIDGQGSSPVAGRWVYSFGRAPWLSEIDT